MSSEDEQLSPLARRDRICSDFIRALKAGERPSIEDYVAKAPIPEQPEILAELVREEHIVRWHAGDCPTLTEYQGRFPNYSEAIQQAFYTKPNEGGIYAVAFFLLLP
jgi:hypothetical protein